MATFVTFVNYILSLNVKYPKHVFESAYNL